MHHKKRPSLKRQARALTWVCYVRGVYAPAVETWLTAFLGPEAGSLVKPRYEEWFLRWPHLFGVRA